MLFSGFCSHGAICTDIFLRVLELGNEDRPSGLNTEQTVLTSESLISWSTPGPTGSAVNRCQPIDTVPWPAVVQTQDYHTLGEEVQGPMKEALRDLVLVQSIPSHGSEAPRETALQPLGTPLTRKIQFSIIKNKQISKKQNKEQVPALLCIWLLKEPADSSCAQQRANGGCAAWKGGASPPFRVCHHCLCPAGFHKVEWVGNVYHLFQGSLTLLEWK